MFNWVIRIAFFATFAFTPTLSEAKNFSNAYLAFTGPSPDAGFLGHVFFVFTERPKVFSGGEVYQYNVDLSQVSMPVTLSTAEAEEFIFHYTGENREVKLYRLNLSASQIEQIKTMLERDLGRNLGPYSSDNNCISNAITVVNSVISDDLRVKTSVLHWPNHIPLFLNLDFEQYPIVDSKGTFTIDPLWVSRLKINLELSSILKKAESACGWSKAKRESIEALLFSPQTAWSESLHQFLSNAFAKCESKLGSQDRESFLDLLLHELDHYSTLEYEKAEQLKSKLEKIYLE